MKLFYNGPSPYARKVIVAFHERHLRDRIKLVPVNPWEDPADLLAATPVGKVPALATDDGRLITESTTIAQYLNTLGDGNDLFAPDPMDALVRTALAQGVMDAAFGVVIEARRPAEKQWSDWTARQQRVLERTIPMFRVSPGRFDLGDIALACGLAYLDFRLPDVAWRTWRPDLALWLDRISGRPSMEYSRP